MGVSGPLYESNGTINCDLAGILVILIFDRQGELRCSQLLLDKFLALADQSVELVAEENVDVAVIPAADLSPSPALALES